MGERTEDVQDADLGEALKELAEVLHARRNTAPEESYTARLLTEHPDKLYKKLVEEALEVVLAAKDNDHDHIRYEVADLVYHLMVLMERSGVSCDELAGELRARMVWHAPQLRGEAAGRKH